MGITFSSFFTKGLFSLIKDWILVVFFGMYSSSISSFPRFTSTKTEWKEILEDFSIQTVDKRLFMNSMAQKLGLKNYEDWYSVKNKDIVENVDFSFLSLYGNSLSTALLSIYPEFKWELKRLPQNPSKFYRDKKNCKMLLDGIGNQLGIRSLEDWYHITSKTLIKKGGSRLLNKYEFSLSLLLSSIYPHHLWQPWKFTLVPKEYWHSLEHRRRCFKQLETNLAIIKPVDWYSIKATDVIQSGGAGFLKFYGNSVRSIVLEMYPDYNWNPWGFSKVPSGFWTKETNLKEYMSWLGNRLDIKGLEDWYLFSRLQIFKFVPVAFIDQNGGLTSILYKLYPNHSWDHTKLSLPKKKSSQGILTKRIQDIFPNIEIRMDYFHPNLKFESGHNMQLDLYLPDFNLAMEYHGEQHYEDTFFFGKLDQYQMRDKEKREACQRLGITLIEIPYWWDFQVESLMATIQQIRPELIQGPINGIPISTNKKIK